MVGGAVRPCLTATEWEFGTFASLAKRCISANKKDA